MDQATPEMIDVAEANIRADYRQGKIDKRQFQKEMLIMTRARAQLSGGGDDGHRRV